MKKTILSFLFATSGGCQNAQKQAKPPDSYIQETINLWIPPGLVVAAVKGGNVTLVNLHLAIVHMVSRWLVLG